MCDDCLNNPDEAPVFPGQLFGLRLAEIITDQSLSRDEALDALAEMTTEFVRDYLEGDMMYAVTVLPEVIKFAQFTLAGLVYIGKLENNGELLQDYAEGFRETHEKWLEARRLRDEQHGITPPPSDVKDDDFWNAA
jgi:hypothetical protein